MGYTAKRALLTLLFIFAVWPSVLRGDTASAVSGILSLFDRYAVVGIGEERHGKQQNGEFYLSLIRDQRFAAKVNDIVLECANQVYQPVLDRYVAGENVSFAEISQVWRNTTQIAVWDAPVYQNVIDAIREVNKTIPRTKRIRVLAGDPPIDWSRIHTLEEYNKYTDRETPYAQVIEREVLARQQTALVIIGRMHLTKSGGRNGQPNARTMLDVKFPGKVCLVSIFDGGEDRAIATALAKMQPPVFVPVDSPKAAAAFERFVAKLGATAGGIRSFCDAVLYIAPPGRLAYPAAKDLDADYVREMARRIRIVYGPDWRPVYDGRMGERALLMRDAIDGAKGKGASR